MNDARREQGLTSSARQNHLEQQDRLAQHDNLDHLVRQHLNDAEYGECLAQEPSRRTVAHLEVCKPCRTELQSALSRLSDVRLAGRHWSETRAARMRLGGPVRRPAHALRVAFAGGMLAIVAPAGVYLTMHMERHDATQAKMQESQQAHQIARDNALLLAVNDELDESVAPAMQPLMLSSTSSRQGTRGARVREEGQEQ